MGRQKTILYLWLTMAVSALCLWGCTGGQVLQETPTPPPTKVSAINPVEETPAPPPLETPLPPSPSPPEETPVITEEGCTLGAAYGGDVTIPDDTLLAAGEHFVKTWRLRNDGSCAWEPGIQLRRISGEAMSVAEEVLVTLTEPEATTEVSVEMIAPSTPGTYRSDWRLHTAEGLAFGSVLYVQIVVGEPASPPTDFSTTIAEDCTTVTFTWNDGQGENRYLLEGAGLSAELEADTSSYIWADPPAGSTLVTLAAYNAADEELGRLTTTVTVACAAPQPDLVVETIDFDRDPVARLSLGVTVRIANQGTAPTGGFEVEWWGGRDFSNPSCTWEIPGELAAGESRDLTCTFVYASPYGSITSRAEVDPANIVTESDETNNVLERNSRVVAPVVAYDLVEQAHRANWVSGSPHTELEWGGSTGDSNGFATWVTSGRWETGAGIQGRCLETHPKWVNNGYIFGYYTDIYYSGYTVEEGDRFQATVGLLQGAAAGDVIFKVMIRLEGGDNRWIASVRDTYGDGLKTLDVDLTPYVGSRADFILRVEAGESSEQDWACWGEAAIYRYP